MNSICGRQYERQELKNIFSSKKAEFLAIYGRRRIGKTYLIHEFFKDKGIYFELTGMYGGKLNDQLRNFSFEVENVFGGSARGGFPSSWNEAFHELKLKIENIKASQKIILFFDELPWLVSPRSDFLSALEYLWNKYLSRNSQIILIVCGSAAFWMIKNVINNPGGLHGRISKEIRLQAFNLEETRQYLGFNGVRLDLKQIVDIYMVMGGVVGYLNQVEKGKSSAQIINKVCFSRSGMLFNEFNKLYRSLFKNYKIHVKIIKELAQKRSGLTKNELLEKAELSSGGTSTGIIQELQESGFISYCSDFGKQEKSGKYRLVDEYSLFYLKWIEGSPNTLFKEVDPDYWLKKQSTSSWNSWAGYSFEGICLKHIVNIKKALGISAVLTKETGWYFKSKKDFDQKGAQIDLVIDRADKCINLCEIKYCNTGFIVNQEYAKKLQYKKQLFIEETKTKKTVFTTLITPYGIKKNASYHQIVDNQVILEDLIK